MSHFPTTTSVFQLVDELSSIGRLCPLFVPAPLRRKCCWKLQLWQSALCDTTKSTHASILVLSNNSQVSAPPSSKQRFTIFDIFFRICGKHNRATALGWSRRIFVCWLVLGCCFQMMNCTNSDLRQNLWCIWNGTFKILIHLCAYVILWNPALNKLLLAGFVCPLKLKCHKQVWDIFLKKNGRIEGWILLERHNAAIMWPRRIWDSLLSYLHFIHICSRYLKLELIYLSS